MLRCYMQTGQEAAVQVLCISELLPWILWEDEAWRRSWMTIKVEY